MKFDSRFKYSAMEKQSSEGIRYLLAELKEIAEWRIDEVLGPYQKRKASNKGALDKQFLHKRNKRNTYLEVCEAIASELNELGHQLLPLDQNADIDLEKTSVSWATDWQAGEPHGLDLEFLPGKVTVLWVLSPNT